MSFGDHLDELRRRTFLALAAPIPLALLIFFFADHLRAWLEWPLRDALRRNGQPDVLQSLSATETMGVDLKLSIIAALVLSTPWILWQIWKFTEPGLYEHERRFARFLVPGSFVLVLAGVATLYFILLPLMLQMLVNYGLEPRGGAPPALIEALPPGAFSLPILDTMPNEVALGQAWIKMPERALQMAIPGASAGSVEIVSSPLSKDSAYVQQYRLSEYHDFVLLLLAGIAIVFQMPLAILLLGWIGVVRVDFLRRHRKHALFVLTIIAAIITPTSDLFSLVLMLVPLYLLYELGIVLLQAAPPSAIAEGSIFRGVLRRVVRGGRTAPESDSSGKRPWPPAQSHQPTPPEQTLRTRPLPPREPDDAADEASAGDDRS